MDNVAQDKISWAEGSPSAKKQLFVAIDHGLSFPDMPGLEQPFPLLKTISANDAVDGLIASPGIYRQAEKMHISLDHMIRLITVDYVCVNKGNNAETLTDRAIIISDEDASEYHPNGYKMFLNIYDDNSSLISNMKDFSRFASAGKRLGVSALAEVLFYNNVRFQDPKQQSAELLRGCRIAMELGADMLKIPMIRDHEAIAEIIDRIGLPVYILGGGDDHTAFIEEIKNICRLRISGLMIGRNIWQSKDLPKRIHDISSAMMQSDACGRNAAFASSVSI